MAVNKKKLTSEDMIENENNENVVVIIPPTTPTTDNNENNNDKNNTDNNENNDDKNNKDNKDNNDNNNDNKKGSNILTRHYLWVLVLLLLLSFIPVIVMRRYETKEIIIFIFDFIAIIPLSNILTLGIDDLTTRTGPAYASVLHAFSGNFVELVIESFALADKQYAIVRSAILGAVLCNITLVLGVAFLAGSWPTLKRRSSKSHTKSLSRSSRSHTKGSSFGGRSNEFHIKDPSFESKVFVDTSSSILALAVLALVIPAAFKIANMQSDENVNKNDLECDVQNISHATSIILLLVFVGLLVFQLKTHADQVIDAKEFKPIKQKYHWLVDLLLIAIGISGITYCARFLVTSVEEIAEEYHLGSGFIGVVIFPLCVCSNFIEHFTAIKCAFEDRVDTAMGLIMNTSVQMILLVTPILTIAGWIMERPLTLDFSVLEISVLACTVLIVNFLVADNRANWLEGYMLIVSYFLIAIAFFYLPNPPEENKDVYHCNPFTRNLFRKNITTESIH